jgi:RNA polymerase sigma-70 factor (ECF subfamily)
MKRIKEHDPKFVEMERSLKELFLKGLEGDQSQYEQFLKLVSSFLRAYFKKRLLQIPDEVEDLVQETLLGLHNQRHTFKSDQILSSWIYAIARYKLIDLYRSRSVRESLHDPLDEEMEMFAHSETDMFEAQRDLNVLLNQLPDRQRLPIVHVKLQGLSVIEAAQLIGMTPSAIKVGIHRGLKALASQLRK